MGFLPQSLHHDHRDEMLAMVRERLRDRKGLRRVATYLSELSDLYRTIIRERLPRRRTVGGTPGRGGRDLSPDLRYVLRSLRRRPGYAIVVIAMLAIGIGANTAMFTLVDSVVLRPLSLPQSNRLVYGYGSFPLNDAARVSPPDFLDYRAGVDAFESLAGYLQSSITVANEGPAESIRMGIVTPGRASRSPGGDSNGVDSTSN